MTSDYTRPGVEPWWETASPAPCPKCGSPVPEGETTWLYRGKFYCSEECARLSGGWATR